MNRSELPIDRVNDVQTRKSVLFKVKWHDKTFGKVKEDFDVSQTIKNVP